MVVIGSISILNHIMIEDAVGSVKIHDGTLIKANLKSATALIR